MMGDDDEDDDTTRGRRKTEDEAESEAGAGQAWGDDGGWRYWVIGCTEYWGEWRHVGPRCGYFGS